MKCAPYCPKPRFLLGRYQWRPYTCKRCGHQWYAVRVWTSGLTHFRMQPSPFPREEHSHG